MLVGVCKSPTGLQVSQRTPRNLQHAASKRARSQTVRDGAAVALSLGMTINNVFKWLAGMALIATAAGVLSGCYVETRRPHYYHRPVLIVR
ncbi:MAG TPA: hypothetical protein VGL61_03800 [Kofleriaceae bacterium]|jgi:hypothetical protein